jgi:transcriptional regulator with XRE-family HTH domain
MRIFSMGILAIIRLVRRNIVGSRVRQARKSAKPPITQIDLVARLQLLEMTIDQSGLSKIENGQRPVSDVEVIALAKALKVSAEWLLEGKGDSRTPQSNKRSISPDSSLQNY